MKTTSNLIKHALTFLVLLGWASFATGQTTPDITVEKMVNDSYENYNLYEGTDRILAGQKDTFKIVISEPSPEGTPIKDFFFHSGRLKVFVPDDAGLALDKAELSIPPPGDNSDISFDNDSLSSNQDTLFTDVNVEGDAQQDEIVIENLIIEFPDDLSDEDQFVLEAWADFMDTNGDGAAEENTFDLVTFQYAKPKLEIDLEDGEACHGEQVVCNLDITPADLTYELIIDGSSTGTMVDSGDVVDLSYGDVISVKDTGNTNSDGVSGTVTIDDTYFQQLVLQISNSYDPNVSYCKGKEIEFKLQGFECYNGDGYSSHLYFKEEEEGNYRKVTGVEISSFFSYAPPGNGFFKVGIEEVSSGSSICESDEVEINNLLVLENHYGLVQNIRLSPADGKHNMFNEFTSGSETLDVSGNQEINGLEYYKENIADTADYRFGRFVFDYKGDDQSAYRFFNPNDENVGGTGNGVAFNYGKYFSEAKKYCFDSTEATIEVDRGKIFIPEEHFCANEDSPYEIRIDESKLPSINVGEEQETIINYKGYSIHRLHEGNSANISDDDEIEFIPSHWDKEGTDVTAIEIKAFADVIIREISDDCPEVWKEYPDGYEPNTSDYGRGNKVLYGRALYRCDSAGTTERPGQGSDWTFVHECFDDLHPIEIKKDIDIPDICQGVELWQPTSQDPTYTVGDRVMNNGKEYKCIKNAYPSHEPRYHSNYWEDMGPCYSGGSQISEFDVEYASEIIYIYQPKDDGAFVGLDTTHGILNKPITLISNYDIENVNNGGGGVAQNEDEDIWTFTPQNLLGDTTHLDSANLELVYSDNHGCIDTSDFQVYVGEEYNPGYPNYQIQFNNLDTTYCAVDNDYEIMGNFEIDSLSGFGFFGSEEDCFFNPQEAINSGAVYNETFPFYIEITDNEGYWRRDSFDILVYPQPDVEFAVEDVCFGDTAKFDNQTVFGDESDSLTWNWSFGDFTSVSETELITDNNPISGQSETANTTGTYKNPGHEYSDPGVYKVDLNVMSEDGCADQHTDTIVVGEYPRINFEVAGHVSGYPTTFDNYTGAAKFDAVNNYFWQYGDASLPDTMQQTSSEHTFDSAGVHNVILTAITQAGCASSDSLKVPVFDIISVTSKNPYHANFDNSYKGWLPAHSFDKGLPSGWKLKEIEAPLKTHSNLEGRIWQTADPEYDLANERSWVESPCFILDDLDFPLLSVDIYESVEEGRDGAVIQYSLDDGDSWQLLSSGNSTIDKGMNWYNTSGIVSNPGDQQNTGIIGWSANTKEWHTSRFPLDEVKEEAIDSGARCVRFRMFYSSDGGTAQGADVEGFAFDNFNITSRSRIVMIEQFVNSVHNKDLQVSEEAWLDEFMKHRPVEAVDMRYHNYISHDYDPLYYLNPPDISARSMEYLGMVEELTMVDGIHRCLAPAEDSVKAYYNLRTLKDKRFDVDVQTSKKDGALHVKAEVTKLTDTLIYSDGTDMAAVRMALVQKEFEHEGNTYNNIVVELLPDGVGNVVANVPDDFPKGGTVTAEDAWHPAVTTIGNEFRLVVYVQGVWGRDEVHQVWFTDLDEDLIPQVKVDDPFFDPDAYLTGNMEEDETPKIDIYPVPVKDKLSIEWKHAPRGTVRWKLISLSGRVIKQKETARGMMRESINMANVKDGVYILVMYDEESSRIEKWKIVVAK